jgi:HK97 family phage portal protein
MAWYNTPIRWPFKAETKSASVGIFFPTVTEPFGMNSFEAFAFEGYKRNSTAYQCVNIIARAIADLPIKIFKIVNGEEVWQLDHPLWQFIGKGASPNPTQSWLDFMLGYWVYRHVAGDEYIWAMGSLNRPVEFKLLRPDRMKPKQGAQGQMLPIWEYTVNGKVIEIPAEEILHTNSFDPLSDKFGMPIFEACASEIDQDNNAGAWNNSLLENGGRPSLFFGSKDIAAKPPSPAQEKMLKNWMRENVTGTKNAGKPLIMPGLNVTEVGKSPKDMDWLKGMIQNKVAIANVCGVPPELIGIQDQKTYSNYETALKAFHQNTVLPYANDMFQSFTQFLGGRFQAITGDGSGVIIEVDVDNVAALQESQDAKHERLRNDTGTPLLTINEGRAELDFDPVDGGDDILVPASLATVSEVTSMEPDNEVMPDNLPIEEEEDETEE